MRKARDRLSFTGSPAEAVTDAEVVMIAVNTPSRDDGSADTQHVERAARDVAEAMQDGRVRMIAKFTSRLHN